MAPRSGGIGVPAGTTHTGSQPAPMKGTYDEDALFPIMVQDPQDPFAMRDP